MTNPIIDQANGEVAGTNNPLWKSSDSKGQNGQGGSIPPRPTKDIIDQLKEQINNIIVAGMVNAQAIGEYNSEIVTDQILSLVESAISQTKIEMVEKATKMKKIIHQPPDGMNNGDDGIVFRVVYNQAISDLIQSLSKDL